MRATRFQDGAISTAVAAFALGGKVAANLAFKLVVMGVMARGRGLWLIAGIGVSLGVLLATPAWMVVRRRAGR